MACKKACNLRNDSVEVEESNEPVTFLCSHWLLVFLLHSSASYLDYAGSAMKIKQGKP